ncbi:uracil-DNA glycosylase family protein [Paenibacillus xerothermodurans]|uniref:Uracil-DNA glycosylase-like domain-containing protein n=1 Tax=Paenibacillus xerothermodurans TaxID=1977292 RepID=A0A2W1NY88_PAEXE|nr:uracil-DNA glycosylase family protein [Paenibacillus xerothermodurans]PZE19838.1 hypothetical protein CBW46_016030 [Paenibacillus xerothermodurans]
MRATNLFLQYAPAIMELPVGQPYTKEQLLTEQFLLRREGTIEMYYAPHNEYVNSDAKVVLIGITPGWHEMELAYRTARAGLEEGLALDEIGKRVKMASQFVGPTRANIVTMLNKLGLHARLGICDCAELFDDADHLLYSTAILGYPVFVSGRNYNGHSPALQAVPFLKNWAVAEMTDELTQIKHPLLIPLGRAVQDILRLLAAAGVIQERRCLWGFPHPSGANGHRHRQFEEAFGEMRRTIAELSW